jgi:hypothetical protein
MMQGKVAGVQVLNNSGAPGGGTTVRIRAHLRFVLETRHYLLLMEFNYKTPIFGLTLV